MSKVLSSKLARLGIILLVLLAVYLLMLLSSDKVKSITEALTPPNLPELQVVHQDGSWLKQYWPEQNWGSKGDYVSDDARKYHHISQGTRTIPIPYQWFVSLEQPSGSLWSLLLLNGFSDNGLLSANEFLLRLGFIRSQITEQNPDGLPIGFARTDSVILPGYPTRTAGIGFTCAACHTGHFVYGEGESKTEYVIDGAPATTDLSLFTETLAAAMGQTLLSSKLPILDGRFDRFARRVLGASYSPANKLSLAEELASVVAASEGQQDVIQVNEGFMRLDALNRIGNQVFAENINRRENYHAINAPVNYPHLWSASWFNWVQYDASIMSPLIRNAGEAMGVNAYVDMQSAMDDNRFSSSIPMQNLVWLEHFLGGEQPSQTKGFSGLQPPKWQFGPIDQQKAELGASLYQAKCQGCHLPPLDSPEIWQEQYFSPIVYQQNGEQKQTAEKVLQLKLIDLSQVGTDPAQANVLATRTLSTARVSNVAAANVTPGLGIDETICGENPNQLYGNQMAGANYSKKNNAAKKKAAQLVDLPVNDSGEVLFGLALGAIVQETVNAWFKQQGVSDKALQAEFEGGRPNCIRVTSGYKARPLNGVWATAPFLHNGSVATLRDLLCPEGGERPKYLQLGNIGYDAVNLGLQQPEGFEKVANKTLKKGQQYTAEGYFILDTSIPGNHNSGHHFSDLYDPSKHYLDQPKGVIGTAFDSQQCDAIIEYLKTI